MKWHDYFEAFCREFENVKVSGPNARLRSKDQQIFLRAKKSPFCYEEAPDPIHSRAIQRRVCKIMLDMSDHAFCGAVPGSVFQRVSAPRSSSRTRPITYKTMSVLASPGPYDFVFMAIADRFNFRLISQGGDENRKASCAPTSIVGHGREAHFGPAIVRRK